MLLELPKPEFLESGERARLIPTAHTSKERYATSCLLATLMSVQDFAQSVLQSLGLRCGKQAKIECFTEIIFRNDPQLSTIKTRPDGLIIISTGRQKYKALVEAKIGPAELNPEQIETYIDLARKHNIDAVITISNQFATIPTHHPVSINKSKLRRVTLYHWSWTYLLTEAAMWINHYDVSDPEQKYILQELVRYLQHEKSGVVGFKRMNATWNNLCSNVQNGVTSSKNSTEVRDSVAYWHQLMRNLSFELSSATGTNVIVLLARAYRNDMSKHLEDDCMSLVSKEKILKANLQVPDAAAPITLAANLETRTIAASMQLNTPENSPSARGRIGWLLRQLKKTTDDSLAIRAIWPGRIADTRASLRTIKERSWKALLAPGYEREKPKKFEVELRRSLGNRFKGAENFVKDYKLLVRDFYEQAAQNLKKWTPSPPPIKNDSASHIAEHNQPQQSSIAQMVQNISPIFPRNPNKNNNTN